MPRRAAVISWNRVEPAARAAFERWHTEEHLPERLGIDGFLSGRRYRAVDADRDYLIAYDVRDFSVLQSPAYLARLNSPTPWTRQVTPSMRDSIRGLCHVAWRLGASGNGVFLAAIRLPAGFDLEASQMEGAHRLQAGAGITAIWACRTAAHESRRPTVERMNRTTEIPQGILLIEGLRAQDVRAAGRHLCGETGTLGLFELQCELTRAQAARPV